MNNYQKSTQPNKRRSTAPVPEGTPLPQGNNTILREGSTNNLGNANNLPGRFSRFPGRALVAAALFTLAILLLLWMVAAAPQEARARGRTTVLAGPDLTLEITLNPAAPGVGQPATLSVIYRNIGDSNSAPATIHAYKDPADRPPTGSTAPNLNLGLAQIPSLNAGGSGSVEKSGITFDSIGCDHVIYVWIDRGNTIAEGNENNNLIALPVCVGVECTPDGYEEDNACNAAGWITENSTQARTFCHAQDNQLKDEDWVKLTAFADVTYTLAASNAGIHADPRLELYNSCGGALQAGPAANLVWKPPASGIYYTKLTQANGVQGPLSAYSLTLSSQTGITDDFEPDNRCNLARDIGTDGARQTHLFQAPNDEDWVKFAIQAGESFIVVADNVGQGVNPVVTLFNACNQVAANNSLGQAVQQVANSAPTDSIFYARLVNQNQNNFGANARYDVRVVASACVSDDLEEDDNFGQAQTVTIGGAAQTHNVCPASDEDWVKFSAEVGKIYVLRTANLAFAADTVLQLYDSNGSTLLAENDDYDYVSASRIVWQPTSAGVYYARVRHANPIASGPNTTYDLLVQEGFCQPDDQEGANGNNGPGDAALALTNGISQTNNFCADPLNLSLGDQDWLSFNAVAGGNYQIYTTGLGANSDPVLELYAGDGDTQLLTNDDVGAGRGASLHFTPTVPGPYFIRVLQNNSSVIGNEASYQLQVFATEPPTPTPTPSPTPSPTPTPTPSPTPQPSTAQTLILVNRARFETIYGSGKTANLMAKLLELADDSQVSGLVLQLENDPAVASAYAEWTTDATTLADNDKANAVVGAIRNRLFSFADNAPQLKHVVLVGDDRLLPYRRVLDRVAPKGQDADSIEPKYAPNVQENGTVKAALAANMILTDDYLVDKEPSQWQDKQQNKYEFYLPDYATGRLVEDPDEIIAFINNFLGGDKLISTNKVLVTGYDFIQDNADLIKSLYGNDALGVDGELIGPGWKGDQLRTKYLQAAPRFDIYAINGHSTHVAQGTPDKKDLTANEVANAASDMSGALVYSLGCHGGLNDPGVLDLPQAYMQKLTNYVGNTGFGWGGSGIVYSESLLRHFSRELLRDTKTMIGPALTSAKKKYYTQAEVFNAFDVKILMQMTLYGLPMVEVTSGGALIDDDPFPSAQNTFTPPTSFGGLAEGTVGYLLPGSFGAFGADTSSQGVTYSLDENATFAAGDPQQPQYFANASAPAAGPLRGAVFLGGVYSDVVGVDPVIARADNEYVTDKTEPTFSSATFYPAIPFTVRSSADVPGAADTMVMSLGQFKSNTDVTGAAVAGPGINRIYDQMSFGAYYSNSPDRNAANIAFVDGVLDPSAGVGQIKVEATDPSGVYRVVVAYQSGSSQWKSKNLSYNGATLKWTGVISGTVNTQFFVQVVDNAGNVAINDNKGRYYTLVAPLPLAPGRSISRRVYLPIVVK